MRYRSYVVPTVIALSTALLWLAQPAPTPAASTSGVRAQQVLAPAAPAAAATPHPGRPPAGSGGQNDPLLSTATPTRTPTPINVGNFVWEDLDADGRQDASEPGVAGVIVQLWNATKTSLIDSGVTNANGLYTLQAPSPGNYRVRVLLPVAGAGFTVRDNAAAGDQLDSDFNPTGVNFGFTEIYTFGSNLISITTIDAGLLNITPPTPTRTPTPINVGNFVWEDLDADGQQDAGEPGVGFVTVQLWNAAKTQMIDSTTTNANGNYALQAPSPGDYRVRVVLPVGASFSVKDNAAAGDQFDSDFNSIGISLGFTDIYTFGSNLISITTIDAGLLNVPAFTPTATATPTPGAYMPLVSN